MVIAVASVALALDLDRRTVGVGLGSVGPTALGAPEACAWLAARSAVGGRPRSRRRPARRRGVRRALVAAAARPIDDHRVAPTTAATRSGCCEARAAAVHDVSGTASERDLHAAGERRRARGARRLDRREPALRAARAARPPRGEDRVRAGRVRLVLGARRRRARVLLPGARRVGRRLRDRDARGTAARRTRRAHRRAAGVRRRGRGAVRLLHAGSGDGGPRPARPRRHAPTTSRSARRSPATCAAAPATGGCWPRSGRAIADRAGADA